MLETVAGFVLNFGWRDLIICVLVLTPLEHLLPLHEKARLLRRGFLTDVMHLFVSGIFIRFGLMLVIVAAAVLGASVVPGGLQDRVMGMPLWLQVVIATVIADLGFYLAHRAMHRIPALWRFHAIHHSSEEMDWLAAYRVHPVDQVIVKGASLVPMYALGFTAEAILIAAVIYHWQAMLVHSNIRVPLGPLRFLVVGPEFHHWHHANEREAYDKNFSGQLPVWDWVFRTLHMPGRMPVKYGVDDPVPETWAGQMAYPFRTGETGAAVPEGAEKA
jgi:sterol desaturase/sphingolipid hydroxylase (fatty acid hydroxylase superfamily)